MRKTKIICTLGPSTDAEGILESMLKNGMNVARMNFSHGSHDEHKVRIAAVKEARAKLAIPCAILLDTKGPEIRTKTFKNGSVELIQGQIFTLTTKDIEGDEKKVSISYKDLPRDLSVGSAILIDDGLIGMVVDSLTDTDINCKVLNGGIVSNRKSLNVPGTPLSMKYLSEQDEKDILCGIECDVDFIAASFVRNAGDVLDIRRLLERSGGRNIRIIAKIENQEGVNNADEIIKAADGIMIARGDMGVEIEFAQLPHIQKMLIKKCVHAGKVCITATQMLESMIKNPRPTRAETSDVANAVYDGTSAIMLSGETSVGKYPLETLMTMADIAIHTEQDIDYIKRMEFMNVLNNRSVTAAISHATCTTAHDLSAAAIVTFSISGRTARNICMFRPNVPIIACTSSEKTYQQLALSWGIVSVMANQKENTDQLFDHAIDRALQTGIVKHGDLVVITAGVPLGISGSTNTLKVHIVGNIIVTGSGVNKISATGNALAVCTESAAARITEQSIVLLTGDGENLVEYLKKAKGIIMEGGCRTSPAAIVALACDIPVIFGAANASKLIKDDDIITIDASHGIVYGGVSRTSTN